MLNPNAKEHRSMNLTELQRYKYRRTIFPISLIKWRNLYQDLYRQFYGVFSKLRLVTFSTDEQCNTVNKYDFRISISYIKAESFFFRFFSYQSRASADI